MTTPSSGPNGFDDAQANLGGADAVDKTTYVTGRGSDPEDAQSAPDDGQRMSRAAPATGMSAAGWALIGVAVLIALFFGVAIFR